MIIDSSAFIAMLRAEPEASSFVEVLTRSSARRLSAANFVEVAIAIDAGRNPVSSAQVDTFIRTAQIEIVAVTESQAHLARAAYRDYGKGSGHPAQLNFGDCFAYALAKETGEPLLYKGNDFIHTDLRSALDANPL